jgi:WD40 repeat protein
LSANAVNLSVTRRFLTILALLLLGTSVQAEERAISILQENCQACHNPQKHKGGLVLSTRELLLKGNEDGPVIQAGKSSASKLIEVLAPAAEPHMPPKGQLTADEIEILKKWIDAGAAWPADVVMTPATRPVALKPLPPDYRPILAMAISADGKRLAASRGDHLLVFDLSGKEKAIVADRQIQSEPIFGLAWSADGKLLASGGYQKVRVWDMQSAGPNVTLEGFKGRVGALAFSPDNQILIAADTEPAVEASIYQFALATGAAIKTWEAHADAIQSLKITADGAQLITASSDKLVKIWDRVSGKELGALEGHNGPVMAVALSPDGSKLATAGADKEIKVWDFKTHHFSASLTTSPAAITDLLWLDNKKIISSSDDGVVRQSSEESKGRAERSFSGATDITYCIAISPDGKSIYAGSHDGNIYDWNVASGKLESPLIPSATTQPTTQSVATAERKLSFVNDIMPILSRAGCNAGACHAKAAGQNGFKLSVFAYDPKSDFRMIVKDSRDRRIFAAAPDDSLFLKKPTMTVEHGGGLRLRKNSDAYRQLVKWIEQGTPYSSPGDPTLSAVEVIPKERISPKQSKQALKVIAKYSDGSVRDVTSLASFTSSEKEIAQVDENGLITLGETTGEAVVVVRYMGLVDVSHITVPADQLLPADFYAGLPANNFIDRLVYDRLGKMGFAPSDLCSDAEFIRRASLDAIGRLPTNEETKGFLADQDPQKRAKFIDRLLDDPSYADHWSAKWADLLRPNPFRAGVKSTYVIDQWLRESFRQNKPYDQFAREILVAQGNTHKYGPVNVFRDRREPSEITTMVSQVFMGVRLECARCHHHPNEKWSQEDFYQLAAFFGQLKHKGQGISTPISGEPEFIWFAPGGEVRHPVSDEVMKPKAPDGPAAQIDPQRDPREALASWLTQQNNPFFAQAAVNRVWAELLGRGIVHPVDDFRTSNPPTNDPLLQALAKDFVEHGYDLKQVIRTIMRSRTYQLSSVPNDHNVRDTKNYSRWYRRRPSGEVLLDAVCDVTGVGENLPGVGSGVRAVQSWNYRMDSDFLDAFSRPNASADPPCERDRESSIVQALHLMNSTKLTAKIANPLGRAVKLAESKASNEEIVKELYLAAYCRYPSEDELKTALGSFSTQGATRMTATQDLLWALINSAEFVLNH